MPRIIRLEKVMTPSDFHAIDFYGSNKGGARTDEDSIEWEMTEDVASHYVEMRNTQLGATMIRQELTYLMGFRVRIISDIKLLIREIQEGV